MQERRGAIVAKLDEVRAAQESALAERRTAIIEGDDVSGREAERRLLGAERQIVSFADALAELDARIAATQESIAADTLQAEREAAARERDAAADKIETAAIRLERAAEVLAREFGAFVDVIDVELLDVRPYQKLLGVGAPMDASAVARSILAQGLFHLSPDMFRTETPTIGGYREHMLEVNFLRSDGTLTHQFEKHAAGPDIPALSGAADAIAVAPLRSRAADIRAGRTSPERKLKIQPPAVQRRTWPTVEVVFAKGVTWIDDSGTLIMRPDGRWTVPVPVADAAFAAGVAWAIGSSEADAHIARRASARLPVMDYIDRPGPSWSAGPAVEDHHFLIDLEELRTREEASLREAAE